MARTPKSFNAKTFKHCVIINDVDLMGLSGEASWRPHGASWSPLGPPRGHLWAPRGPLGPSWGPRWALLA
eukprot:2936208-Pyramimonas_sp.AAC.1